MSDRISKLAPGSFSSLISRSGLSSPSEMKQWATTASLGLKSLASEWNNKIYPLLTSLPQTEDGVNAFTHGLDGRALYSDPLATVANRWYWNSSQGRPRTINESYDALMDEIERLENIADLVQTRKTWSYPTYTAWTYFPATLPSGVSSSNLKAYYKFDGTVDGLTDRSGNGNDLSSVAGHTYYTRYLDLTGLSIFADQFISAPDASLQITGALTVEILFQGLWHYLWPWTIKFPFGCAGDFSSDLEAENALYWFTVDFAANLSYFSESGAGVDFSSGDLIIIPAGMNQCIHFTRTAAGVYAAYQNGYLIKTGNSTPPTGGANTYLQLGHSSWFSQTAVFSIRVLDIAYDAAQVSEAYQSVRKP